MKGGVAVGLDGTRFGKVGRRMELHEKLEAWLRRRQGKAIVLPAL